MGVDSGDQASVIVNGSELPLTGGGRLSLDGLLTDLGFLPRSVVVELNGEAVAPSEFKSRRVRSGDRLEVVRIVAGGR